MILINIGMSRILIIWIMTCVQSTIFAVIINHSLNHFFKVHKGLRQGCAFSILLFFTFNRLSKLEDVICKRKQGNFWD